MGLFNRSILGKANKVKTTLRAVGEDGSKYAVSLDGYRTDKSIRGLNRLMDGREAKLSVKDEFGSKDNSEGISGEYTNAIVLFSGVATAWYGHDEVPGDAPRKAGKEVEAPAV